MRTFRPNTTGLRSGAWSENKLTNFTPYNPYYSEIDRLAEKSRILFHEGETLYFDQKPATELVQPLTIQDIKSALSRLPEEFTKELKGVFLCKGSKKQLRTKNRITFGCYSSLYQSIFLFPISEQKKLYYSCKPKPSVCIAYERHGAVWKQDESGCYFEFSPEALRSFYIWDVLYHEVGHHVDYLNGWDHKNNQKIEGFAEWFALHFGMRKQ